MISEAERLRRIEHGVERIERKLDQHFASVKVRRQPVTDASARDLALTGRPVESVDVRIVFDHWRQMMAKKGNTKLTAERRKAIQARLKEGYTVKEIMRAIEGCAKSDFHMAKGEYRGGKRYDDLTLILRNGSRLENFRDAADPDAEKVDMSRFL